VTEEELAGAKVTGFLVHQRDLRSAQAMGAIGARFQIDQRNPVFDQSRVLPGADVLTSSDAARKQPIVIAASAQRQPGRERLSSWICDLERHGPAGLLLDNGDALAHETAGRHIADPQLDQVASSKLGIYGAVEQGHVAHGAGALQLLPYRPDVLRFEGSLGAHDPARIPGCWWRAEQVALGHRCLRDYAPAVAAYRLRLPLGREVWSQCRGPKADQRTVRYGWLADIGSVVSPASELTRREFVRIVRTMRPVVIYRRVRDALACAGLLAWFTLIGLTMSWVGNRPPKPNLDHPYPFNDHRMLYLNRADLWTAGTCLGVGAALFVAAGFAEYIGRKRYQDFVVPRVRRSRAPRQRGRLFQVLQVLMFLAIAGAILFTFDGLHHSH
jgi:hypothetical protein